jgi:predicted nucleic acid-binding protein
VIVVDTNVVVAAILPGDSTPAVRRLLEHDPAWTAPPLWRIELRNVLATAMRLRGLPRARAIEIFEAAEPFVLDAPIEPSAADCFDLVERGGITAYDAEFLFVAERLDLPFVTADRKLARAFPTRVVPLAEFATR